MMWGCDNALYSSVLEANGFVWSAIITLRPPSFEEGQATLGNLTRLR